MPRARSRCFRAAFTVSTRRSRSFTFLACNGGGFVARHSDRRDAGEGFIGGNASNDGHDPGKLFAAAGAGLYHHVWVDYVNSGAVGTVVQILDGSTIIHEFYASPSGGGFSDAKPIALVGSANTALSIKTLTSGCSLYYNARGYYIATTS